MLVFGEQVRLELAFEALWADSSLDGPYAEPGRKRRLNSESVFATEQNGSAWGEATVAAETVLCRSEYELWPETPAKVLSLWLHADDAVLLGADADEWLCEIGKRVRPALPYNFGVVGDGFLRDFWGYQSNPFGVSEIPRVPRRSFGLLIPDAATWVTWHPPGGLGGDQPPTKA